ncbi:hypothetical protein FHX34_103963 [Actinoplanes teichomyceticus]|uniref:Uncharacterized protein n=1 Tax=Actinoplanes teichomyceticus TaxID=1867 RepID=A0A561WC56_ACTTI|nr:hypothetical protein FHX34_103963 [Actinoplanes teichomyceticus]
MILIVLLDGLELGTVWGPQEGFRRDRGLGIAPSPCLPRSAARGWLPACPRCVYKVEGFRAAGLPMPFRDRVLYGPPGPLSEERTPFKGVSVNGSPGAADLIQWLKTVNPENFASHAVLDTVPWIFRTRSLYIDWKSHLAKDLEVDPYSLIVVGSACTRYSLNPTKGFSEFHPGSDIDVAVISARHFDEAWRALRSWPAQPMSKRKAAQLEQHRRSLVFDGTIATNDILSRLDFGPQWSTALNRAGNRPPTEGHSVKTRIYRDFESLREYQVRGIKALRENLLTTIADGEASANLSLKDDAISPEELR